MNIAVKGRYVYVMMYANCIIKIFSSYKKADEFKKERPECEIIMCKVD